MITNHTLNAVAPSTELPVPNTNVKEITDHPISNQQILCNYSFGKYVLFSVYFNRLLAAVDL